MRLRVSADAPAASLSVKLCDVFPDGTSALVTRGTVDLAFRDGVHGAPAPLEPGQEYDVVLDLDACAYAWDPGNRLRVSVAGADWPNTVAPPAPVALTVHGGVLELPVLPAGPPAADVHPRRRAHARSPWATRPGRSATTCCAARRTPAPTRSRSTTTPYDGRAREDYLGEVSVDRRTHEQHAHAVTTLDLTWPEAAVQVRSTMDVSITGAGIDVEIETVATRDGAVVSTRTWREAFPARGDGRRRARPPVRPASARRTTGR